MKIESETENDNEERTYNAEGQQAQGEGGVHQVIEVRHAPITVQCS